jgi:hypothetical protein
MKGKYLLIKSEIAEALSDHPREISEIYGLVHDALPEGVLSPETRPCLCGSSKNKTKKREWHHEIRAAAEDMVKKRILSLDRENHLYSLNAEAPDIISQLEDEEVEESALGQGFISNSKKKKMIEQYAMRQAHRYFERAGYVVKTHAGGRKYDLTCFRRDEEFFVEVKGTTNSGESVLLTAGEVDFARRHSANVALYVLHSIRMEGDRLSGGEEYVDRPWSIDAAELRPTHYLLYLSEHMDSC